MSNVQWLTVVIEDGDGATLEVREEKDGEPVDALRFTIEDRNAPTTVHVDVEDADKLSRFLAQWVSEKRPPSDEPPY